MMKPREMSEALKAQRFGVEIEMYGITRRNAARYATEMLGGDYRYTSSYDSWVVYAPDGREWKFSRDASIVARTDEEKCELVTPILNYGDIETLCNLIRMLRSHGAKSDPTHMCGVHIHVDGAGHTAASIRNLVRLVYSREDEIAQGINLNRGRECTYCEKVDVDFMNRIDKPKKLSMDYLEQEWYRGYSGNPRQHYHKSRYHMLNLHSFFNGHGTVEFRCFQFQDPEMENGEVKRHNGLHAGQLKAMIQMALAINNAAKQARYVRAKKSGKTNAEGPFRSWLYRIGFVGEEFATARKYWVRETERTMFEQDARYANAS